MKGSTGIPAEHASEAKDGNVDARGGVVAGAEEQQRPKPTAAADTVAKPKHVVDNSGGELGQLSGTIKPFSKGNGYGFISCPKLG